MNVYLRELSANRKSLIIWSIAVLFMVIAGMSKYGGFTAESGALLNDLMAGMPKSLQAILGVGTLDLSTATGYFGMLYLYLVLMTTIHAVMLGANILSKEERDHTVEFLYAKPISRTQVITAKLLAAVTNILILNGVTMISSFITIQHFDRNGNTYVDVILLMIGMLVLQFLFMFIGTALAAYSSRPQRAATLSTAVLLVTFILSIIINMSGKIDALKFLTPFKYFEAKDILTNEGFNIVFMTLSLMIIIVMTAITYIYYRRRDLQL